MFLYDRQAGVTHILSPEAWMLLDAVDDVPSDVDALLARVSLVHDVDPADDTRIFAAARLAELAAQGLIEQAGPPADGRHA